MNKQDAIEYVPKNEARKFGYYIWEPTWFSYEDRPKKISPFLFAILSVLPWYKTNPFNGYLVKMNKWAGEDCFTDFVYNPHEKTDSILKDKLGFNYER